MVKWEPACPDVVQGLEPFAHFDERLRDWAADPRFVEPMKGRRRRRRARALHREAEREARAHRRADRAAPGLPVLGRELGRRGRHRDRDRVPRRREPRERVPRGGAREPRAAAVAAAQGRRLRQPGDGARRLRRVAARRGRGAGGHACPVRLAAGAPLAAEPLRARPARCSCQLPARPGGATPSKASCSSRAASEPRKRVEATGERAAGRQRRLARILHAAEELFATTASRRRPSTRSPRPRASRRASSTTTTSRRRRCSARSGISSSGLDPRGQRGRV